MRYLIKIRNYLWGISMRISKYLLIALFMIVGACAAPVTIGERVFITPSDSAHLSKCKMLGQVEVEASIFGKWDYNQQSLEIKNRLRDETAIRYPTADTVSHSDLNIGFWKGPDANIMGTAFKCFD